MTSRVSVEVQNAALNAAGALVNGGYIEIRTGSQPATVATAATGTLLATLPLSATAFAAASGGSMSANAITSDSVADASGTAGWYRAYTSGGLARFDGAVGAEMTITPSAAIVAGGVVAMSAWTLTI